MIDPPAKNSASPGRSMLWLFGDHLDLPKLAGRVYRPVTGLYASVPGKTEPVPGRLSFTDRFPEIESGWQRVASSIVLPDGKTTGFDKGYPDVQMSYHKKSGTLVAEEVRIGALPSHIPSSALATVNPGQPPVVLNDKGVPTAVYLKLHAAQALGVRAGADVSDGGLKRWVIALITNKDSAIPFVELRAKKKAAGRGFAKTDLVRDFVKTTPVFAINEAAILQMGYQIKDFDVIYSLGQEVQGDPQFHGSSRNDKILEDDDPALEGGRLGGYFIELTLKPWKGTELPNRYAQGKGISVESRQTPDNGSDHGTADAQRTSPSRAAQDHIEDLQAWQPTGVGAAVQEAKDPAKIKTDTGEARDIAASGSYGKTWNETYIEQQRPPRGVKPTNHTSDPPTSITEKTAPKEVDPLGSEERRFAESIMRQGLHQEPEQAEELAHKILQDPYTTARLKEDARERLKRNEELRTAREQVSKGGAAESSLEAYGAQKELAAGGSTEPGPSPDFVQALGRRSDWMRHKKEVWESSAFVDLVKKIWAAGGKKPEALEKWDPKGLKKDDLLAKKIVEMSQELDAIQGRLLVEQSTKQFLLHGDLGVLDAAGRTWKTMKARSAYYLPWKAGRELGLSSQSLGIDPKMALILERSATEEDAIHGLEAGVAADGFSADRKLFEWRKEAFGALAKATGHALDPSGDVASGFGLGVLLGPERTGLLRNIVSRELEEPIKIEISLYGNTEKIRMDHWVVNHKELDSAYRAVLGDLYYKVLFRNQTPLELALRKPFVRLDQAKSKGYRTDRGLEQEIKAYAVGLYLQEAFGGPTPDPSGLLQHIDEAGAVAALRLGGLPLELPKIPAPSIPLAKWFDFPLGGKQELVDELIAVLTGRETWNLEIGIPTEAAHYVIDLQQHLITIHPETWQTAAKREQFSSLDYRVLLTEAVVDAALSRPIGIAKDSMGGAVSTPSVKLKDLWATVLAKGEYDDVIHAFQKQMVALSSKSDLANTAEQQAARNLSDEEISKLAPEDLATWSRQKTYALRTGPLGFEQMVKLVATPSIPGWTSMIGELLQQEHVKFADALGGMTKEQSWNPFGLSGEPTTPYDQLFEYSLIARDFEASGRGKAILPAGKNAGFEAVIDGHLLRKSEKGGSGVVSKPTVEGRKELDHAASGNFVFTWGKGGTAAQLIAINTATSYTPRVVKALLSALRGGPAPLGDGWVRVKGPGRTEASTDDILIASAGLEETQQILDAIGHVAAEHPSWFAQTIPQMMEEVRPGVAVGHVPELVQGRSPEEAWENLRRRKALAALYAIQEAKKGGPGADSAIEGSLQVLEHLGINPFNPHLPSGRSLPVSQMDEVRTIGSDARGAAEKSGEVTIDDTFIRENVETFRPNVVAGWKNMMHRINPNLQLNGVVYDNQINGSLRPSKWTSRACKGSVACMGDLKKMFDGVVFPYKYGNVEAERSPTKEDLARGKLFFPHPSFEAVVERPASAMKARGMKVYLMPYAGESYWHKDGAPPQQYKRTLEQMLQTVRAKKADGVIPYNVYSAPNQF